AKGFSYRQGLPLIGVHHLAGHLAAVGLEHSEIEWPAVGLVVSGGHTNLYLMPDQRTFKLVGQTVDDAAGEAFDKGAKMLGLPYPGGPAIDRIARGGDSGSVAFPRPQLRGNPMDMSFSGLKTSLRYYLERTGYSPEKNKADTPHLAAAYQQAIVDVLVNRTVSAAERHGVRSVLLTGGVAANSRLRSRMTEICRDRGWVLLIPNPGLCTDNGAMIAAAGYLKEAESKPEALRLSPRSVVPLEGGPDSSA
ncbi:MAG TPA: tRNA (adenosine(37)-N6)-threonylcarbamoyltransferase complex transferase subunit TsaD, partial [Nitrospiria bacterium]